MNSRAIVSVALRLAVLAALAPAGCSSPPPAQSLTLATTTSARDSGLLEEALVPLFQERTGIEVKVVAVGTGQALGLGRRGDADVLLVHDPEGEQKFVDEGFGVGRRPVMWNDFVVVGPPADPAGVRGQTSAAAALSRIAAAGAPFVSRGDESGTHVRERATWKRAGVEPGGDWYLRAGDGMAAVLRLASEKRAYALSDRGTYLAQRKGLDLAVLCEGDPALVNQYSVIRVNPEKHPHVRSEAAARFADFLLDPAAQAVIADFGKDRFGAPLFFPGEAPAGRGR
jgi:tungstate transport system substrate-binding protein